MLSRISLIVLSWMALAGASWAADGVEVVEPEYVCMVSDAAYDEEQVRVEIDGKTYYGCCEMCKGRLAREEALRVGVDPVSGKEVDKATAVIGTDSYRRVFYFESEENLAKFNEKLKKSN